jgi:two-component sensor histidine kinase
VHPDDRAAVEAGIRAAQGRPGAFGHEFRIVRASDAEVRTVQVLGEVAVDARGVALRMAGTVQDVTERKRSEEQLARSLAEKEVLLKEIHHRVKNNLQVISSLLSLQARKLADPALREPLLESQGRVQSIALFHETLYRGHDLSGVQASAYLRELVDAIFRASSPDGRLRREVVCDDVHLGVDTAVPCGLILNELLSNAIKHAYPGGAAGTIRVELRRVGEDRLRLVVEDDGVGLPADLEQRSQRSLGLQLVQMLAQQLGGAVVGPRAGRARFEVEFPLHASTVQEGAA